MKSLPSIVAILIASNSLLAAPAVTPDSKGEYEIARQIDQNIRARWKQEEITPSRRSNDAEFIRRLYLDLTGRIPSAQASQDFITSRDRSKRTKTVEKLVNTSEAAENWADLWVGVLVGQQLRQQRLERSVLEEWIAKTYRENMPYDVFVRQLLTAEGYSNENPAVNFALKFQDSNEAAGAISKIFLGVQIQCAQCHNHPYEKWTQDDFNGFAAFFSKTQARRERLDAAKFPKALQKKGNNMSMREKMEKAQKVRKMKRRFQVTEMAGGGRRFRRMMGNSSKAKPKFLGAESPSVANFAKLRPVLADWVTSSDNPYFAKAAVNRIWSHLMGRGIIHPLDDIGENNPPSHPEVLDLLARDFIEHSFDVKRLLRIIARTSTYQLSSRVAYAHKDEPPPDDIFAWQQLKPLTGEQILRSLVETTGLRSIKSSKIARNLRTQGRKVLRQFHFAFATDEQEEVSSFEGTIPQALLMMNSMLVNESMRPIPGNTIHSLTNGKSSTNDKITKLFLAGLTRYPSPTERLYFNRYLREQKHSVEAWADLLWSLVNSSEFMFIH